MRNEFEKQVQQKMEELSFVPSAPVWDRVEEQITRKKDRRRAFIWLPLLAMLLAGGVWWLNDAGNDKTNPASQKLAEQHIPSNTPVITEQDHQKKQDAVQNNSLTNKTASSTGIIQSQHTSAGDQPLFYNKNGAGEVQQTACIHVIPAGKISGKHKDGTNGNAVVVNEPVTITPAPNEVKPVTDQPSQPEGSVKKILPEKKDLNANPALQQPLKAIPAPDSPVVIKPSLPQKASRSRWNFGVELSGGISGVSSGLGIFKMEKAMDVPSPSSTSFSPPLMYSNHSPRRTIRQNLSLRAGVIAKRKLGKKFTVSAGLEYAYLSTQSKVGVLINQTSALMGSNQYYINYGNQLQEYFNRYHFISVPVGISYKVFRKIPLNVHADVAVRYLVKTNALQFNSQTQSYYYNKDGFHRTQLYPGIGLEYAFLKNRSLVVGPHFEYGVTPIENTGTNHHLYAYTLKAQWMFSKK